MTSSNSGVWPGSTQPPGLLMRATLTFDVPLFTRPTNSSMSLGLFPAAWMTVGFGISVAMAAGLRGEVSTSRAGSGIRSGAWRA